MHTEEMKTRVFVMQQVRYRLMSAVPLFLSTSTDLC